MWKRFWIRLTTTVAGGAVIIGTLSVVSRFVGLLRDRLLFSAYGAGDTTDIYFAAFKVPDFIFNLFVLGALSVAFIPVFMEYWHDENKREEAWHIAQTIMTVTVTLLTVLAGIAIVFAPWLVPAITPGFSVAKQEATVQLTRIMLLSVILFGISNVLGSILNAFRRFVAYGMAPVVYNVGIIVGILFLAPHFGRTGLAWGVVLGAALHLLVQLPSVLRLGYRWRWQWALRHAGVRRIGHLILPRMFGLAVYQVDQLVVAVIATTLAAGSLSVYTASNNLQHFPINVIGVSLAIASFPVFTQAFVEKRTDTFVHHFSRTIRRILFYIIPLSVLILLLRAHIVRVILGAGAFDWQDTILTAQMLGFFSLSLFAQALLPTLTRSFYALQDTRTPVVVALFVTAMNITGAITLSHLYGVIGIAMSFSVVSVVHMVALFLLLRRRIGDLDDMLIIHSVLSVLVASAFMGVGTRLTLEVLAGGVNQQTFVGIFLQGMVAGTVGIVLYMLVALLLRLDDIDLVRSWLRRMKRQLFNGNST